MLVDGFEPSLNRFEPATSARLGYTSYCEYRRRDSNSHQLVSKTSASAKIGLLRQTFPLINDSDSISNFRFQINFKFQISNFRFQISKSSTLQKFNSTKDILSEPVQDSNLRTSCFGRKRSDPLSYGLITRHSSLTYVAEMTGVEPAQAFTRRLSKPLPYR